MEWKTTSWDDILHLEESLNEEERIIQDQAKAFCQTELMPGILEAVNTHEGTHDVHALILGRLQTGINAF